MEYNEKMNITISTISGIILWTFMEYAMHYWNGHKMNGKTLFSKEHLAHHVNPDYFTPNWLKVLMSMPPLIALGYTGSWLFGTANGVSLTIGFLLGYVAYEVLHYRMHAYPPKNSYSRWVRKHHFYHHYEDPNKNHGILMSFWDVIFRTRIKTGLVKVPKNRAMDWLLNPRTGEIRNEFKKDYVLKERIKRISEE